MAFKVGQKVKIVKNLGERQGRDQVDYYYGGDIGQVPLGAKAVILNILDPKEKIVVKVRDREWQVHPNELNSLQNLVEALNGIKEIDTHPVLEMASQTPIYVVGGKVYADREEVASVESLDELALSRVDNQLEPIRQTYAASIWKEIGLEARLGTLDLDTPNLIAAQVFPYLRGEEYGGKILGLVGEVLEQEESKVDGSKKKKPKELDTAPLVKEIVESVEVIKRDLATSKIWEIEEKEIEKRSSKKSKLDKLLGYLEESVEVPYEQGIIQAAVGRENFAIVKGKARYLVPPRMLTDLTMPDGKKFDFGAKVELKTVEQNYRRVISQLVRKQVLETKFSEEEIRKVVAEKARGLGKFAGVKNYEENNFGFMKSGDEYYAYITVPAFALKSEVDRKLYLFDKTRIGMMVYLDGKRLKYGSEIKMLDNNNHPFLHNARGDFADICIGHNNLPERGKNNGEVIAKRLLKAKEVLMLGYIDEPRYNESYQLSSGNYNRNRKSEEEITKLGVPIITPGKR